MRQLGVAETDVARRLVLLHQAGAEQQRVVGAEGDLRAGEERRAASVIWLQRLARAAVDPSVAAAHTKDWQDVEDLLTSLLAICRSDQPEGWHRERAGALLALLDGLAAATLTEPRRMPAERAEQLLAIELERLLDEPPVPGR